MNAISPEFVSWLQVWGLVLVIALFVAGVVGYLVTFSYMAYIGTRFCAGVGGVKKAAQILYEIEADNEERLAGALSARVFLRGKR